MEEQLARERNMQRAAAKAALQRKRLEHEAGKRRASQSIGSGSQDTDDSQLRELAIGRQKQDDGARAQLIEEIRKVDYALARKKDATEIMRKKSAEEVEKRKKRNAKKRAKQKAKKAAARAASRSNSPQPPAQRSDLPSVSNSPQTTTNTSIGTFANDTPSKMASISSPKEEEETRRRTNESINLWEI